MRFRDPFTCRCVACGTENRLPVRPLLALTAHCPRCGASLKDIGLGMRAKIDETEAFLKALTIIINVENQLGITTDETIEEVLTGNQLTLTDLATVALRSTPSVSPTLVERAIRSAVRTEFPSAPVSLDFSAPLLDALSQPRRYLP